MHVYIHVNTCIYQFKSDLVLFQELFDEFYIFLFPRTDGKLWCDSGELYCHHMHNHELATLK